MVKETKAHIEVFDIALERRLFHLKTLYEASQEIVGLREPAQIIRNMLMMLMGTLGAVSGFAVLISAATRRVEMTAHRGCDSDAVARLISAVDAGQAQDLESMCCAILAMPLWIPFAVDEELQGGIALGDRLSGEGYTADDYELLATLCSQGGVCIANAKLVDQLQRRIFHLKTLYDVSQEISFLRDPEVILKSLLLMMSGTFGALGGFALLADVSQRRIATAVRTKALDTDCVDLLGMKTAAGALVELCEMAGVQTVPAGRSDSLTDGQQLLSALNARVWVPFTVNEAMRGGIGLGEKMLGDPYGPDDQELLNTLAAQGAVCIQNANLILQMRQEEITRTNLSRYLSPQIVERVVKESMELNLGGRRKTVTILFSDIRGFTTISETWPPDQLVTVLNEYFTEMVAVIFQHRGTIDKFVGDAIVAVFGGLIELENPAQNAAAAAVHMMRQMPALNAHWTAAYGVDMHMGIGITTGEVFIGNIGSPERMEFTVIGDQVNVASRFSGLASAGQILASRETIAQLDSAMAYRALPKVKVKGKAQDMAVFEIDYTADAGRQCEFAAPQAV